MTRDFEAGLFAAAFFFSSPEKEMPTKGPGADSQTRSTELPSPRAIAAALLWTGAATAALRKELLRPALFATLSYFAFCMLKEGTVDNDGDVANSGEPCFDAISPEIACAAASLLECTGRWEEKSSADTAVASRFGELEGGSSLLILAFLSSLLAKGSRTGGKGNSSSKLFDLGTQASLVTAAVWALDVRFLR